jgi:hypothetical protein
MPINHQIIQSVIAFIVRLDPPFSVDQRNNIRQTTRVLNFHPETEENLPSASREQV